QCVLTGHAEDDSDRTGVALDGELEELMHEDFVPGDLLRDAILGDSNLTAH
ncbi:MAG: hypothetical protein JNM45_15280, partial [Rhizobiales bacterium]|nr:hypothetical protein [Hyphomicrobiales bacterium]